MSSGGSAFAGGAEAVGEFLAVISKDFGDGKRHLVNQTLQEPFSAVLADLLGWVSI